MSEGEKSRLEGEILTSTRPWANRNMLVYVTLSYESAPIISKLNSDVRKTDVPKILVAGRADAKKPAGIWVIK